MSYQVLSEEPCGCKWVLSSCNCPEAEPARPSMERCKKHEKEFRRDWAWDIRKQKHVPNDDAFKRAEVQGQLKYLENEVERHTKELRKAQQERDAFKNKAGDKVI